MKTGINLVHYKPSYGEKNSGEYDDSFELEEIEDIEDKVSKYLASGQAVQDARYSLYFGDDDTEEDEEDEPELEYAPDYINWYNQRVQNKIELLRKQKAQIEATKARVNTKSQSSQNLFSDNTQANNRSTETPPKAKENTENSQHDGAM